MILMSSHTSHRLCLIFCGRCKEGTGKDPVVCVRILMKEEGSDKRGRREEKGEKR